MNLIISFFVVVFGLAFGSFFNVCIYRLPKKESIVFPNSHCPSCNRKIKTIHNIPIFSYIWLKGQCSYCGTKIHWHYFLVELITPLLFLLFYLQFGWSWLFLKYLIFVSFAIIIFFIDTFSKIIPDVLSLPLIFLGITLSFIPDSDVSWLSSLLGAFFGFIVFLITAYLFQIATHKESLGGGDIKLIAAVGSFIGILGTIFTVIFGSLFALILLPAIGHDRRKEFPFGPFLVMGALSYILFGHSIFQYYINYFSYF
ncbi:MAG: prepilin peptidase [Candidatus Cloacimonadales bacterium]|nr:prepilin peptidase [Candidatus Cloacimonadales bacterium]